MFTGAAFVDVERAAPDWIDQTADRRHAVDIVDAVRAACALLSARSAGEWISNAALDESDRPAAFLARVFPDWSPAYVADVLRELTLRGAAL